MYTEQVNKISLFIHSLWISDLIWNRFSHCQKQIANCPSTSKVLTEIYF